MNILQAIFLAGLIASLTRIQIVNQDESWSDRATREAVNLVCFIFSWWAAYQIETSGWLPSWAQI